MKSFFLMLIALIIMALVTVPLIALTMIRKVWRKESLHDYFFTIAIGFDQAGGSILYGQEDWTVSSYTYILARRENKHAKRFMRFIDLIFGKEHCEKSYMWESIKQGGAK